LKASLCKGKNDIVSFGSQPEDGFMKKAETCRYCDFLIIS